ncbi:hypothetical protein PTMSG1_03027 [Pyrenophora teres f. maculata]|nr:hypothetical protein PTMSG1_03027 [Pyrenophora teres f. maculata]
MYLKIAILFIAATLQSFVLADWTIRMGYGAGPTNVEFYALPGDGSKVVFQTQWTWPAWDSRPNIILTGTHVEWNSQTPGVRGDGPYWLTRTEHRFLRDRLIPEIGFDLAVGAQFTRPNLHITDPVHPRWRISINSDVYYHEITFSDPRQGADAVALGCDIC